MSQYADILTLLDSSLTSKEVDHCLANHKLIHDCKTKGFKTLEKMGLIVMPEKGESRVFLTKVEARKIAADAAKLMAKGKTLKESADKLGVKESTLKHHVARRRQGKPIKNINQKIAEVIKLVNEDGYRFLEAARRAGASHQSLRYQMQKRGYKYNFKTVRVEAIK